jgi:PAS domain S-box-containing protein
MVGSKKVLDEHGKSLDILFSDNTTVIHMSGNKESLGKILKTSQSLSKVFGYSKTEVVGHSINIVIPAIMARKHTEFLERYFKLGRQVIFFVETQLFATHRNGHCFPVKILVKQMPTLSEGIQYVGMLRPVI